MTRARGRTAEADSSRRRFLGTGLRALAGGSIALPFQALLERRASGQSVRGLDYGELMPVRDETTGLPLLKLPRGFRCVSFGWRDDPLDDGVPTPGAHDGMAVTAEMFGRVVITRNHELTGDGDSIANERQSFDAKAPGGTTNLVFNTATGELERSWVSLGGTLRNCAGGPTPWNSWLTCEETVQGPGELVGRPPNQRELEFEQEHGWVFEVPSMRPASPVPIREMGRFVHEAVAVDPKTGFVYETEDRGFAGFYRFVPQAHGLLHLGGKLQMLKVDGRDDLSSGVSPDHAFNVQWVDIQDPTRAHAGEDRNADGVFAQGKEQGAATFKRLEGCWYHQDLVYFVSTDGGDAGKGQVWAYHTLSNQLRLIFESPGSEVLDAPDNLTVSPRGGILLCEDGSHPAQRLHGLSVDGRIFPFAENHVRLDGERNGISGDFRGREWAGATFSGDGKWLFVNIQVPGITLAITGPWRQGAL